MITKARDVNLSAGKAVGVLSHDMRRHLQKEDIQSLSAIKRFHRMRACLRHGRNCPENRRVNVIFFSAAMEATFSLERQPSRLSCCYQELPPPERTVVAARLQASFSFV